MRASSIAAAAALLLLGAGVLAAQTTRFADTTRVAYSEGYRETFVNYLDVDRIDRKRVRKMYVIPTAHAVATPGGPLPDGTILVMEDHDAQVNADGSLVFDAGGRLVPKEAVTNIFVMEKQSEWDTDNGDWDYAWFNPDGSRRADAEFDGCFSCHAPRADRDFTFTYWKFVADQAR